MMLVCPPAPIKPRLRDSRDSRTIELAVQIARSAIAEQAQGNNACSLQALLQNLPRHLLLPVFNAYCEWAASTDKERGGPFQTLLDAGPPKMDAHLRIVLGISEEEAASAQAWGQLVALTAQDPGLKQTLVGQFQNHTSMQAARRLEF